jgi:glycosyltransferase involved in cell wall biosynthesis
LKFYECLAAGLAVASTPVPAAVELEDQSGELVVPAEGWGPVELVAALNHAISERDRARTEGPAFAARHTWEERARRILEFVG